MSSPLDPARAHARTALFGGEGTVRVWDLGGRVGAISAVLHCVLDPLGRVGVHSQQSDDEVVIVLAGEGVLYVDGVTHACVRGSAIPVPFGARLELDNASATSPLEYLIVKAKR